MNPVPIELRLRSARWIAARATLGVGVAAVAAGIGAAGTANAKSFIDYVKPTPIACSPLSAATWGVAGVLPRDTCNGIESVKGAGVPPEYYYWDGRIIKAKDGVYHMFMSTWAGSTGFQNWGNSEAYHAVSTQGVLGPYTRKGYVWDSGSHHGHNVSAAQLLDGTYAVVVSEVVPFTIYKSTSLDGPWTACPGGELIRVPNGVNAGTDRHYDSNVSLTARADGRFEIVQRHGLIAIADNLCGPYDVQKPTWTYPPANRPQGIDSIYPHRTSVPDPAITNPTYDWEEDPHIWYSGGVYHVIYSGSGDRIGWHLYSIDGITNWKDDGLAFDPRMYQKLFCYEGSTTCTKWYKMERPSVVLEDGHVTHVTWAVADVDKDNQIPAGSNHGSKVIVVPFDGVAFDNDYGVGSGNAGAPGVPGAGGTTGGTGGGSGGGGGDGLGGSLSGGASGSASAGTPGAGGATGNGGGPAAAGASGSGASTSSGSGSGGSGFGGGTGDGGTTSPNGGAVVTAGSGSGNDSSSGCACRTEEHGPVRGNARVVLLGCALVPLVRRRFRRR